jgi:hypothetical protein
VQRQSGRRVPSAPRFWVSHNYLRRRRHGRIRHAARPCIDRNDTRKQCAGAMRRTRLHTVADASTRASTAAAAATAAGDKPFDALAEDRGSAMRSNDMWGKHIDAYVLRLLPPVGLGRCAGLSHGVAGRCRVYSASPFVGVRSLLFFAAFPTARKSAGNGAKSR